MTLDLVARAPLHAWLAERLVREIDEADWKHMREEPLRTILCRLDAGLAISLSAELTAGMREALAEEFARLFLLPRGVSPMTSVWIADPASRESTRNQITRLIENSFAALGREPAPRSPWGKLPLEHLAVVLDLVATAAGSQDELDREVAERLQSELLDPALGVFGAALARESREPIYRAIGAFIATLAESTPHA